MKKTQPHPRLADEYGTFDLCLPGEMIKQSQQQRLLQRLSPQQIQLMKLLQVPTAALEQRIKEELEDNPALELGGEREERTDEFDNTSTEEFEGESESEEKINMEEYLHHEEDDYSDYGSRSSGDDEEDRDRTAPVRVETSFHDHLVSQIGMLDLDERQAQIAMQIIGSIDDDGYLRREPIALCDDLAFAHNIHTDEEEIRSLIQAVQTLDPPGIAATTLQECLLIQAQRTNPRTEEVNKAIILLTKYFTEFTKKQYEKLQRSLGVDDETFRRIIGFILHLNPKPGGNFAELNKAGNYIVPDFFVINNGGVLELTLNARNAPDLRVSEGYREMMQSYERGSGTDKRQKEAVQFIKQKLDSAKWFIDAIRQRQQTLLFTMRAIMAIQQDFFLTGDETTLRPMVLKDVAARTGQDVSTVSRVANSKYVQTEFGTYKLKYFFSEGLATDSGEEVSTREVKAILAEMIAGEDKQHPLADDKLMEMLSEKGYNIARRTVAKYREGLGIPVARLRKQL